MKVNVMRCEVNIDELLILLLILLAGRLELKRGLIDF